MTIRKYIRKLSKVEYSGISPGISRISAVLAKLGNPQDTFPAVHIAGTNGKGSTAAMVASIMMDAGYKVGLYTSPHLIDELERIRINGIKISREEFNSAVMRFMRFKEGKCLTYFELMTIVAFIHYSYNNVDIAVCETGLGGKYDAT
ncbi:MAG: bifunctional folylpolyglutamate synthase/dihydrofolate synthase, partial [Patescibacteria group bacterium]|nr:bifunctional folylpolyglutamate synthase/dihydrofolate synthase [Patescibacteria group bacterium]